MHTPEWIFREGKLFLSLFLYFAHYLTVVITHSNFSSQHVAVYSLLISVHCLPPKKKTIKKNWKMKTAALPDPELRLWERFVQHHKRNYAADLVTRRRYPLPENAYITARLSFSSSHRMLSTYYCCSQVLPVPSKINLTWWTEKSQNWSLGGESSATLQYAT